MARSKWERIALQWTVALAAMVPIGAGAGGAFEGARFLGLEGPVGADSHVRYLSGLLLGIGLIFVASVYRIERHTERFRILGAIVVLGGMVRLLAALNDGSPSRVTVFSLVMELGVTPLICAWQARVAASA
jgi:uncharacterized protein DUF4345